MIIIQRKYLQILILMIIYSSIIILWELIISLVLKISLRKYEILINDFPTNQINIHNKQKLKDSNHSIQIICKLSFAWFQVKMMTDDKGLEYYIILVFQVCVLKIKILTSTWTPGGDTVT